MGRGGTPNGAAAGYAGTAAAAETRTPPANGLGLDTTMPKAAAAAASPSVPALLRALEQSLVGRPGQQEEDGDPQQQHPSLSSDPYIRRRRLGSAALVGYGALLAGALEGKRRPRRPPPPPSHPHRQQADDDDDEGRAETLLRGLRVCSVGLRARRAFDAADALDLLAERLLLMAPPPPQKEEGEGSVAVEAALVLVALARPYDDGSAGASAPAVGRLGRALLLARARDGGGALLRAAYQGGREVGSEMREHCIRQMDEWMDRWPTFD